LRLRQTSLRENATVMPRPSEKRNAVASTCRLRKFSVSQPVSAKSAAAPLSP
jgi:hypothetical protein